MTYRKFLGSIVLFSAVNAFAESRVGNGGDVVVCRDGSRTIQTVELLDIYEARTQYGLVPDLPNDDPVGFALARLAKSSPRRAARFAEQIKQIKNEARLVRGLELEDIPDSKHLVLPAGCTIEQIVIQETPVFPGQKRYLVNADLLDWLDALNQACLWLHEVIYREAFETELQKDSVGTRIFNAYIFSGALAGATPQSLYEKLVPLGFSIIDDWGFEMRALRPDSPLPTFDKTGHVQNATFFRNEPIQVQGEAAMACAKSVDFWPTGQLKTFSLCGEKPIERTIGKRNVTLRLCQYNADYASHCRFGFNERGTLTRVTLSGPSDWPVNIGPYHLVIYPSYGIEFFENGDFSRVVVQPQKISFGLNRARILAEISFNELGNVRSLNLDEAADLIGTDGKKHRYPKSTLLIDGQGRVEGTTVYTPIFEGNQFL